MMHDVTTMLPDMEVERTLPPVSAAKPAAMAGARWRPRSSVLRVRAILYLLTLDLLLIAGSFGVASLWRDQSGRDGAATVAGWMLPLYAFIALNFRAYAPAVLQNPFAAIHRGVQSLVAAFCALLVIAFYLKSSTSLSRVELAGASAAAVLLLAAGRYLFVRHLTAIVGGNPFSSILILDGDEPRPAGTFSVVMTADAYFDPDGHDPMMYDRLARSLETADRVVIACPPSRRAAWARALRGANIQGEIAVPELSVLSPLGLGPREGSPSVIVAAGPLSLIDRCVKRAFDFTSAAVALLLLLPLLILIAGAIKLESPGPALFKQVRIGRGNRQFKLFKFRSMRVEVTDSNANRLVTRDDDRVTKVGRLIRKTSLDELPQLIHILTGQMSIVGPRPHALGARAAAKLYWEVDDRYWHRHAIKPGLTGLAQVRGFRGNTEAEEDLTNRLEADLEYLERWSIWRDFKIIFLTARVLFHRNAF